MSEETLNKILDALSKKVGLPKQKLLELLASKLVEQPRYKSIEEINKLVGKRYFDSDITINDIFKYRLMEKLMGDSDIDLNKVLSLALIKQMFQPDLTTVMLLERLASRQKEGGGGDDKIIQFLLQQQQQQQQLIVTLLTTMMGRKTEEMIQQVIQEGKKEREEIKKEFDEKLKRLADQMAKDLEKVSMSRDELLMYLKQLNDKIMSQPQGAQLLLNMVNQYVQLQEALKKVAKALGITKEQMPIKPTGEIDWGALLNRVMDIAEKYIEVQAQRGTIPPTQVPAPTPTPQPPTEQPQQIQAEQPPAEEEEFKPLPELPPEEQPQETSEQPQEQEGPKAIDSSLESSPVISIICASCQRLSSFNSSSVGVVYTPIFAP